MKNLLQQWIANFCLINTLLYLFQFLEGFRLLYDLLEVAQIANSHDFLTLFIFNDRQMRGRQYAPYFLVQFFTIFKISFTKFRMKPFRCQAAVKTLHAE